MPKEFSTGLIVYIYIVIFIFGACIGSFINCAADRYVCRQSVLRGRSHCPACGHALGILDLFPIFSFLFLGGKCRYCGAKIPVRCLLTELLGGIAYLLVVMRFGFEIVSLQYALLLPALLAVSLIDLDTMEIPNGLIAYCTLIFVLFLPFYADYMSRLQSGLVGLIVFGGGTLALSLVMDFLLKKDTLGGGDIKLFGVLGLYFGPVRGLLMLLLACVVGLPYALVARKYSAVAQNIHPQETFPSARELSSSSQEVLTAQELSHLSQEVLTAQELSSPSQEVFPTNESLHLLTGGEGGTSESECRMRWCENDEMTDEGIHSVAHDVRSADEVVTNKRESVDPMSDEFPPLTSDELLPNLDSSVGLKTFGGNSLPSEVPFGAFPFGPSICFSAFIVLLVGQNLVDLYLSLF